MDLLSSTGSEEPGKVSAFTVWIVDDQIAGMVAPTVRSLYGQWLSVRSFETASAAALEASQAPDASSLPDLAIVDLNFNPNRELEFSMDQGSELGRFFTFDHIADPEIHRCVSTDTPHNQLGFWVAAELNHAADRLRTERPLVRLYTANFSLKERLGWAAAPSPWSGQAAVEVAFKGGRAVGAVSDSEVVAELESALFALARRKLGHTGSGPLIDLVLLARSAIDTAIQSMASPRQRVLAAAEALGGKLEDHLAVSVDEALQSFPTDLTGSTVAGVRMSLVGINRPDGESYARLGLGSEYSELVDALNDYSGVERRVLGELESQLENAQNHLLFATFPVLTRIRPSHTDDFDGHLQRLYDWSELALQILAAGDQHWALCLALKSVKIQEDRAPTEVTNLARACHGRWASYSEAELVQELHQMSLPRSTKQHLLEGGEIADARPQLGDTIPNLDEHLKGLGYAFSRTPGKTRRGWIYPWSDLPSLLSATSSLVNARIGSEALAQRYFLTDWRTFFVGPDSVMGRLAKWMPRSWDVTVSEDPNDDDLLYVRAFVRLDEPMATPPEGEGKRAIFPLRGWCQSITWEATTGSERQPWLCKGTYWPKEKHSSAEYVPGPDWYFSLEWVWKDYLRHRYLGQ